MNAPTSPARMISDALRQYLPYLNLGYQLVGAVGGGFLLGYWIDGWLGTNAVFAIIFSVLGMIAGIVLVVRASNNLSRTNDHKTGPSR